MLSAKQLQMLGKRLRDGTQAGEDLVLLDEYRRRFDPLLLHLTGEIIQVLRDGTVPFVLAGRAKRTKSIIRKLQRPENHGMDLSRVADLVGNRVVVGSLAQQDDVVRLLCESLPVKSARDYRRPGRLYRAVHLIVERDHRLLEVQVRTLPQHLWADEAESFGERAKEGNPTTEVAEYMELLCRACMDIDEGRAFEDRMSVSPLLRARAPITSKLARLEALFQYVSTSVAASVNGKSFIVVYDNQLNTTEHLFSYGPDERHTAVEEYRRIVQTVDESRREVIILNSSDAATLAVTHPRFFPAMTVNDLMSRVSVG